jgi:hypothetical protein
VQVKRIAGGRICVNLAKNDHDRKQKRKYVMNYLHVILIPLALMIATTPYFAHTTMVDTKNRYEEMGYTCESSRETSGPAHTRKVFFICSKGTAEVKVSVWGKIN